MHAADRCNSPVIPVRPPSSMPAADSMYTVSGVVPIMLPVMMPMPSDRKAHIWPGNSMLSLRKPASSQQQAAGHASFSARGDGPMPSDLSVKSPWS